MKQAQLTKRKSVYYARHSLSQRKLKWYANNFEDSSDNWINEYEKSKGFPQYVKRHTLESIQAGFDCATYDQDIIEEYNNYLRLKLSIKKVWPKGQIIGILQGITGEHRPKLVFNDLVRYQFLIERSSGDYCFQ